VAAVLASTCCLGPLLLVALGLTGAFLWKRGTLFTTRWYLQAATYSWPIGFIAILLSFYALNLLPFRSIAIVLMLSAFALFILEAKFQTHGVLGVGGVALMALGGLLLIDGPIPELRVNIWTALGVALPMGAITVFLMSIAMSHTYRQALFAKIFTTKTLLQIIFVLTATVVMKAMSAHYDFSWATALGQG